MVQNSMDKGMIPRQKFSSPHYIIILLPCWKKACKSLAIFSSGSVAWIFLIMGNKILLRHFDCSYLWLVLGCKEGRTICIVPLAVFVMLWLAFYHVIGIRITEGIIFNGIWSKIASNFASSIFLTFRKYRMDSWTWSIALYIWNVSVLEFDSPTLFGRK